MKIVGTLVYYSTKTLISYNEHVYNVHVLVVNKIQ